MSSNNNKQTHTNFTTVNVGDVDLGIPEINQVTAAPKNLVQSAEASTTTPALNKLDYDVKPQEKNDSLGFLLGRAERGQTRGKQPSPSICKVSKILRDLSVRSFIPQLVSIGPIHRENKKLKEFEWQKECYLDDLLHRCDSTPKKTLEACLLKVNTLIDQIRESYAGVIKNYSDVDLARMMVMDGCFILEFCFKHDEENLHLPNKMQNTRIAMDLMLLENQVPFFVLQALFDCSMGERSFTLSNILDTYLAPYIKVFCSNLFPQKISSNVLSKYLAPYFKLFCSLLPEKFSTTNVDSDLPKKIATVVYSDSTPDHVLGYMLKRYQLLGAKSSNEERLENTYTAFHSIVKLDRSGVNFKPHQEDKCSMTFKFQPSLFPSLPWFWSNPALLMPTLVIDDTTELMLRNFIAYEQSFPQGRYYFTSYARAMDMLIDTQEDIAKLVESNVLVNMLGTNQEAADLINKICRNISITDFYYTQEFKQMDKYYNGFWATFNAHTRRISDGGPVTYTMLYLSVIQTYYTVKAA